jgi:formate/nitrite transporter FocA (FNT family)
MRCCHPWSQFLLSLVLVSLGNIIGEGVLVGAVYWLVYLRPGRSRPDRSLHSTN